MKLFLILILSAFSKFAKRVFLKTKMEDALTFRPLLILVLAFTVRTSGQGLPMVDTGTPGTFGGAPTVLWNPTIQTKDRSFGVHNNQFGFTVVGTAAIPIVIKASNDPAAQSWVSLQSCTLTNGSIFFSDPQWSKYPNRLYRISSP